MCEEVSRAAVLGNVKLVWGFAPATSLAVGIGIHGCRRRQVSGEGGDERGRKI
jgi:hypothetical protein